MEEVDRFWAASANGERHQLVKYQHFREFRPTSGPVRKLPTSTEIFTSDGLPVNENNDGTFTMVQTGAVLRRL